VRLPLALRTAAVVIAVTALADPVITMGRSARQPLAIAIIDTPTLALPDTGGTRGERAHRIADELLGQLSDVFAVTVRYHPLEANADPCPPDAACIVISDGVLPSGLQPRDRTLGSIRVGSLLTPNASHKSCCTGSVARSLVERRCRRAGNSASRVRRQHARR
jgi:hypothetical protein